MQAEVVQSLKGWYDPHGSLGLHEGSSGKQVIRLWRPGASSCHLEVQGEIVEAKRVDSAGLFEYFPSVKLDRKDYRVYLSDGRLIHDPYAFESSIGQLDGYFFSQGVHYQLFKTLGANVGMHQGILGTKFAVWAPDATAVSLVGDFNHWDGRLFPLRSTGASGIWEIFMPDLGEGEKYKFEIHTKAGERKIKSDPMAFYAEVRPKTASVVFEMDRFNWNDEAWMKSRGRFRRGLAPMTVYEVHLGSWQRSDGRFLSYAELATRLAAYCLEMGFTHVELMGFSEHPLDESWGYQVTGYYAATSRFGNPRDFQFFVNHLHEKGIGVLIDWVPAHFPMDDHALAQFDGTFLYEHADERQRFHPHWNTHIFNYGRREVSNFLIASAIFWCEKMHIDGLRVDAVASMLYLDYGREVGQWLPNRYGNNINLEAVEFLRHFNSILHQRYPDVITSAEESTAFGGVTRPVEWGGLGFDFKWNMGWMNDTLRYFSTDSVFRLHHHHDLTFVMLYVYSERFINVLSHDEVVHGKASLISKMPGDDWQKFAGVRLLYSYMLGTPGKKLLFMGGEFGQWHEWNCLEELHWYLCQYDRHRQLRLCIRELNHFYQNTPALWEGDYDPQGFEWVDLNDAVNSVLCYLRKSQKQYLLVVHHFTPTYVADYKIRLGNVEQIRELFNTDREEYGGSGKINPQVEILRGQVKIQLAPMATMVFEVVFAAT